MPSGWQPKTFQRFEQHYATSTGVAKIVTDEGKAYIKALGNAEGPHALAREWVGTCLADWFGLPTLDYAILNVVPEDEIPLGHGKKAEAGPAFVTQEAAGHPWSGRKEELGKITNADDISKLVVFDTWIRNLDRHPPVGAGRKPNPDNVFIRHEGPKKELRLIVLAIDHTHCFMAGGEVTVRIADIAAVQDEAIYGLFPQFQALIKRDTIAASLTRLRQLDNGTISDIMMRIPGEWAVGAPVRAAWTEFVLRRATYVADTLLDRIGAVCWPGQLFDADPNA